ncbi:HesA/MoeB/ThiF family protein [Geomonas azotofigens]|uniref:HesA/MoeB/ThiF family protein n=1 Tax=Geomonas azotofigens TaxID=2843196 RepID=UPI001C116B45|nr:HesA/MoeB/ThiF family protein [Geomonas azotofigens]MBU5614083.1 HesA/MoeB/ThiF family protein [Geomonas azotofigens]
MDQLSSFLKEHAEGDLICWQYQAEAARRFRITVAQAERAILEMGLLPARYQRNVGTVSPKGQLVLHGSRVAVVGCGGLGGYVVEHLARLGVGTIVAVDPDLFEEHNLNRQLLSSIEALGTPKAAAAAQRVADINPAVTVLPVQDCFCPDNAGELIAGCSAAVDALDNVQSRLELADACNTFGVPLVHGAIAGWYGQVATQLPGQATLRHIYRSWSSGAGVERELGNPSFTPAAVASLQAAEVCKLLLGTGRPLTGRKLVVDLLHMDMDQFTIPA